MHGAGVFTVGAVRICRYVSGFGDFTASVCYVPIFFGHERTSFSSLLYRKRMLCADISWSRAGFIVVREPTSEAVRDKRRFYRRSDTPECETHFARTFRKRSTGGVDLFRDADVRKRVFAVVVRAYLFGVVLGKHRAAHHYLAVRAIFAQ